MRVAMSILAVGAVGAGLVQIPEVDDVITKFLEPSFAGSTLYTVHTRDGLLVFGLILGTLLGLCGHRDRLAHLGQAADELAVRLRARALARLHAVAQQVVLRRADRRARRADRPRAAGRFADTTFERVFVDGALIGGATSIVRAGSASVRAIQTGLLRYYAALVVLGVPALGLYFLLQT